MGLGANQKIQDSTITNSLVVQVAGDATIDSRFLESMKGSQRNEKLLNRLVDGKIKECKQNIIERKDKSARIILHTFLNYGIEDLPEDKRNIVRFYCFIMAIFDHDADTQEEIIELLDPTHKQEAEFMLDFIENSDEISIDNYIKKDEEVRTVVLDALFNKNQYYSIKKLHIEYVQLNTESDITLDYYYGMASFNIQEYEVAMSILNRVSLDFDSDRIRLIVMIAEAHVQINKIQTDDFDSNRLDDIRRKITEIKKDQPEVLEGCEIVTAQIEILMYFATQKGDFFDIINSYDSDIKESQGIQLYIGIYYENKLDFQSALDIYSNLSWKDNADVLFRLLYCNLSLKRFDSVNEAFLAANDVGQDVRIKGIWLAALKEISSFEFDEQLRKNVKQYKEDVEAMYYFALSVGRDKELFDELFRDYLISSIPLMKQKEEGCFILGIANMFISFGYARECMGLLHQLDGLKKIDEEIVREFAYNIKVYKQEEMMGSANHELGSHFLADMNVKIELCDWFIVRDLERGLFLREKISCLFILKKRESMLLCSEELYECTHDEDVIANIIALLLEENACPSDKLEYYSNELKHSLKPRNNIATAVALQRLRKNNEAKYYSYRALFMLNEEIDFDIYNGFLVIWQGMIHEEKDELINPNHITGKTVVTLQSEKQVISICLDDEAELEEFTSNNRSIGAIHYNPKNPMYLKLQNKKIAEKVDFEHEEYTIIGITTRDVAMFRYVVSICESNPKESKFISVKIDKDNVTPEEICSKLRVVADAIGGSNRAAISSMIESYHSIDNELGLPLDCLVSGNYEKYIEAVRFLLYGKDQALYAGQLGINLPLRANKIVISLSTLVIMAELDALYLIDDYVERILIPASLVDFIGSVTKKMTELQAVSPGTLAESDDGKLVFVSFDKSEVDNWNKIYEKCLLFEQVAISNQDRIKFKILPEISGESLFSMLNITKSQMDCMILAQNIPDAIYISDDLFLRKLATTTGISNTNFTAFVYSMRNKEDAHIICKKISKTNYIYAPLVYCNNEEINSVWENLLEGKYKRKYYSLLINDILEQVLGFNNAQ